MPSDAIPPESEFIIPAQVRAARALLGWSQEQLANEAEIALSSVRDIENERRPGDTVKVDAVRRALRNGGVVFVPGRPDQGPGVRLVANRPHMLRRPAAMQKWEGMPFAVEWQGRAVTVFIAFEVVSDLGGHQGYTTDQEYLKTFDRHRGEILDAITLAIQDSNNFDGFGRLYVRQKDIDALKYGRWHKVVIAGDEFARDASARSLINDFVSKFISVGIPGDVQVFRDLSDRSRYVYYFSPKASEIARESMLKFRATPCDIVPDTTAMRRVQL